MNSVAPAASTASSAARSITRPTALEQWDLIVVGGNFRGLDEALQSAGFQGRIGLVDQIAGPVSAMPLGITPSARLQVERLAGWSVFTGPNTIAVHGREISFHRAILATGARFDATAVEGLAEVGYLAPAERAPLLEKSARVAVLGSGTEACAAAQRLRLQGCDVYLVANGDALLPLEEPLAVQVVQQTLLEQGVRVLTGWHCRGAERSGRLQVLRIVQGDEQRKLLVDQVVLTEPRRANIERLGLEAAGIRISQRQGQPLVQVDSRLATTNPRVFAVGEACAGERGVAALESMCAVAVQNAVGVARPRFDSSLIPRLVGAAPQVAQIGVTAAEALSTGLEIDSWLVPLQNPLTPPTRIAAPAPDVGEPTPAAPSPFAIVHVAREMAGRAVGATFVGPHAAESLSTIALLMAEELPLAMLGRMATLAGTSAQALARLGALLDAEEERPAARRRK